MKKITILFLSLIMLISISAGIDMIVYADTSDNPEYTVSDEEHDHIWDSGVLTQAATTAEDGIITYTCTVCGETKTEAIASPKTVTLSKTTYTYSGSANKPTVTVKDSAGKAISSSYYTVSYSSNTNVCMLQVQDMLSDGFMKI